MAYELSPKKKERLRKQRLKEEERWAKKSGAVTVRRDPSIIKKKV